MTEQRRAADRDVSPCDVFLGRVQRPTDLAHGALVSAILDANPEASGILFDLPSVVDGAKQTLRARGLSARCEVIGGDFFVSVPEGADVYLLKLVLHDWDDEQCIKILENVASAMRPASRVLVVEMVIPDDRTPSTAQLMDVNMLTMLPGRERTLAEYSRLFDAAGLKLGTVTHTRSPMQIVAATLA